MRLVLVLAIAGSTLCAAPVAEAYLVTNTTGTTTSTPGAVTFANFDAPTIASIATISGGSVCPGPAACSGATNPTGTAFLSTRASAADAATITFTGSENYFGLVWGTPDSYNTLTFFRDATMTGSFTGTGIVPGGFTNFTASSPAEFFNRIVLSSSSCCFEVDNLAAPRTVTAVPETSTLALLVTGLGVSVSYVRRRLLQ
jgi:hypothetical protein